MPDIPEGLPTIGKATLTLLRSQGVTDALSVVRRGASGYEGIPGLGPAKWSVLTEWARAALTHEERKLLAEEKRKEEEYREYRWKLEQEMMAKASAERRSKREAELAQENTHHCIVLTGCLALLIPLGLAVLAALARY